MSAEIIGWASSLLLLATMIRQVFTQWRTRSVAGVSRWLFIGQLAASTGFTIYSFMLENWIFTATNAFMVVNALLGEWIYMRNKRITAAEAKPGAEALA